MSKKFEGSVAPRERINISYVPKTDGQTAEVELPLNMLVVGDTGNTQETSPLDERQAVSVNKHNFGAVCIAGQKKWLLSGAQFGLFSAGGRLLSTAQFARWVKFGYCYRQHISEFRLLSKRVRTGLLSSAHFRQWGCYRAHSFQTVEFWRLLLSTAHF